METKVKTLEDLQNLATQWEEFKTIDTPNLVEDFIEAFKKGGKIHINPENKGKFTETKKRTGKTTEELTHSKNPVTRKRAIFAQNSARWNKK